MNKLIKNFILIIFLIALTISAAYAREHQHYTPPTKKYQWDLALCAVFQNEARFIKEWIDFHKLVGVQHFYLFNNLSTDHYLTILQPYLTSGEVELFDWPYEAVDERDWNTVQCSAYEKAIDLSKGKARWLAILDLDEFLFSTQTDNLVNFLAKYEGYGGLAVNWQLFGTSHVSCIPEGKLMIEMLTMKAPAHYSENIFVKSIVHPHLVKSCKDPHFLTFLPGFYEVNPHGDKVSQSTSPYIDVSTIRINHYWSRDEVYFYGIKCPRRQKWREGFQGQLERLNNLNQVSCNEILRFVPKLKSLQ